MQNIQRANTRPAPIAIRAAQLNFEISQCSIPDMHLIQITPFVPCTRLDDQVAFYRAHFRYGWTDLFR